jgi:excisionase family DNA binding protein
MAKGNSVHIIPGASARTQPATTHPNPIGNGQVVESFINKEEVARRLGKTMRTVDNWMSRGLLPYFKIGRSVSFKWSDVEKHLEKTCRVCR